MPTRPGCRALAYDPAGRRGSDDAGAAAADTQASINGIAVTRAATRSTTSSRGITFNLSKVTTQPVTVNVTRNTDAIKTFVSGFVSAYNALNTLPVVGDQYDAATKQAALLQGDGTTTGIHNQLRSLVSPASPASSFFTTLSSIGVHCRRTARSSSTTSPSARPSPTCRS
jgi:flagellar hook-associated protein 2